MIDGSEPTRAARGSSVHMLGIRTFVALAAALTSGCYLSHQIGEDIDTAEPPEVCWTVTSGPHWITETPPTALSGSLVAEGDGALVAYSATNLDLDDASPRALVRVDAEGRPVEAPTTVFPPPEGEVLGSLRVVDTVLGRLALAFDYGAGCQIRELDRRARRLGREWCSGPQATPEGVLVRLGRLEEPPDPRRFALVTSVRPLEVEEGALGVVGEDTYSWQAEPLGGDDVLFTTGPRHGGPLEVGLVDWRSGARDLRAVADLDGDLRFRHLRLLPNRGGWALAWLEEIAEDAWRMGFVQLDGRGRPTGPIAYPPLTPVNQSASWQLFRRDGEINLVFDTGDEVRIAQVTDRDFVPTGRLTRVFGGLGPLASIRSLVLPDGAVLLSFTQGEREVQRVGTVRIECLP